MRPNTVFLTGGVLALVFGLSFLLVPAMVLPVYGAPTDPATVLMSRFFGVALLQLGLLLYFLKDVRDAGTIRALCLAGVAGSLAGARGGPDGCHGRGGERDGLVHRGHLRPAPARVRERPPGTHFGGVSGFTRS